MINSGTIIGTGGTALQLSGNADTLTLLSGSRIVGAIDMGGGNDVVSFRSDKDVAQLVTLKNFTGTINNAGSGPQVHSATQIATLDPTAFAQADRGLVDFSGGVSSLIRGRLGAQSPSGFATQAVSFAPEESSRAADRVSAAFAGVSSAMAYGADNKLVGKAIGKAPAADYAAPVIWANGFGGTRTQDATDQTMRSTSSAWAGVIGIDRKFRPDLLLGAFIGGGAGRLSVDKNSQEIATDYIFGGAYGRFDWVSHFLDFTLQGGGSSNKSTRSVASNLALNGLESATASYSGWYLSPEIAYGVRYRFGDGYTLTPSARLRYVAGFFDGYSEAGSGQNLAVGGRTLQDFVERGEIELAKTTSFGGLSTR